MNTITRGNVGPDSSCFEMGDVSSNWLHEDGRIFWVCECWSLNHMWVISFAGEFMYSNSGNNESIFI